MTYMTEISHQEKREEAHRAIGHKMPDGIGLWPSFDNDWLLGMSRIRDRPLKANVGLGTASMNKRAPPRLSQKSIVG